MRKILEIWVIRHLTALVTDKDIRKNWPKYLPYAQRIMNTLVKTSTGVSPTELIFGTSVNQDYHFLTTPKMTTSNVSHHEHIKELVNAQERMIKLLKTIKWSMTFTKLLRGQKTTHKQRIFRLIHMY